MPCTAGKQLPTTFTTKPPLSDRPNRTSRAPPDAAARRGAPVEGAELALAVGLEGYDGPAGPVARPVQGAGLSAVELLKELKLIRMPGVAVRM